MFCDACVVPLRDLNVDARQPIDTSNWKEEQPIREFIQFEAAKVVNEWERNLEREIRMRRLAEGSRFGI